MLRHCLAKSGDHVASQHDILLDGGIPEVKVSVLEALDLIGLAAAVYLKGKLLIAALAEDLDLFGDYFDVACGYLRVLACSLADNSLNGDRALLVDGLESVHHLFALNNDLRGAVEIADNYEREVAADLADVLHPADYLDFFSCVFDPQLAAVVCTGLYHSVSCLLSLSYKIILL